MTVAVGDHPAPFSASVLREMQYLVDKERQRLRRPVYLLDPFAGVGRIHSLTGADTVGVELEPEWAACNSRTEVGDATALRFFDGAFDAVITSPCYASRMSDAHDAKDTHKKCKGEGCATCKFTGLSPRKSYRVALGRRPSPGSAAVMQWGPAYRRLHRAAIDEMVRVVAPGGLIAINMSDHVRDKAVVPVVTWWRWALEDAGLRIARVVTVATPRMRNGENYEARVDGERILVCRKAKEPAVSNALDNSEEAGT